MTLSLLNRPWKIPHRPAGPIPAPVRELEAMLRQALTDKAARERNCSEPFVSLKEWAGGEVSNIIHPAFEALRGQVGEVEAARTFSRLAREVLAEEGTLRV